MYFDLEHVMLGAVNAKLDSALSPSALKQAMPRELISHYKSIHD